MNEKLKRIICGVLCAAVVVALVCAFFGYVFTIKVCEIVDPEVLSILEQSNPKEYALAKQELRELVKEEVGVDPDQVCFFVKPGDVGYTYVHIYYKTQENWYGFSLNRLSPAISSELDSELMRLV